MKKFRTRRHVAHSAAEMFALVKDVESYPKFVPLCEGLRVRRRNESAPGVETLIAEMQVGFRAICEKYASKVVCDANRLDIHVTHIDGPFRVLDNRWRFVDEAPGPDNRPRSIVEFAIEYEFKSFALGLVMGAMFDKAVQSYADAFAKRADVVYGRR
jgi:coenzyme Q-binding protein COQ10